MGLQHNRMALCKERARKSQLLKTHFCLLKSLQDLEQCAGWRGCKMFLKSSNDTALLSQRVERMVC